VGILRDGELVAQDSIEALRETVGGGATLVVTVEDLPEGALDAVRAVDGVTEVHAEGSEVTVACESSAKRDVLDAFEEAGAPVRDFATEERSLEDLFLAYTEGER
jgi:ABC-2 type transport system ATP-binding protein